MKSAAQTFLTDRKRVAYYGSAKTGTAQHWQVTISSVALVVLIPLFIFTFGAVLGAPWEEVVAYYSRPFPALVAVLTFVVSGFHLARGTQVLIEDYSRGMTRKVLIIATTCLSYGLALAGVYALARLAL